MQNSTVNSNPAPVPAQDPGIGPAPSSPGASQQSPSTSGTGQSGSGQSGSSQSNKPGFGRVLGNVLRRGKCHGARGRIDSWNTNEGRGPGFRRGYGADDSRVGPSTNADDQRSD